MVPPLPHVEGDLFEDEEGEEAEGDARERAEADLREQHLHDLGSAHARSPLDAVLRREDGGKDGGEHVRGRVVGAGFHLQKGGSMVL